MGSCRGFLSCVHTDFDVKLYKSKKIDFSIYFQTNKQTSKQANKQTNEKKQKQQKQNKQTWIK